MCRLPCCHKRHEDTCLGLTWGGACAAVIAVLAKFLDLDTELDLAARCLSCEPACKVDVLRPDRRGRLC